MPKEITDHVAFLKEARTALLQLEEWKGAQEGFTAEEKKAEKTFSEEQRIVTENVQSTIKKRREEISGTYAQEIKNEQEKLKKEKSKRAKAKEQGVRNRMAEETAHLVAENQGLKTQTKELFRKNRAPRFCNSTLYYALYFPRGMKELLLLAAVLLVCVLGVPSLIYLLIPDRKVWMFVALVIAFVFLWLAVYMLLGNKTKIPHFETLKEGRKHRNTIAVNKRRIRKIKKGIRRDSNEDAYNLAEFDQAIAGFEGEIQELRKKQEEALSIFDQETDPLIRREIQENNAERLAALEQHLVQIREKKKQAESEVKARTIQCAEEYESYIGKEFMTKEKLEALMVIFETQAPANLAEAENIYRTNGQKKV